MRLIYDELLGWLNVRISYDLFIGASLGRFFNLNVTYFTRPPSPSEICIKLYLEKTHSI